MAIPKKGSRQISVQGISYKWTVRQKPSYSQGAHAANATAAVELFEHPESTLSISFPFARCDNWLEHPSKAITPSMISECIQNALNQGWNPHQKGTFLYEWKSN